MAACLEFYCGSHLTKRSGRVQFTYFAMAETQEQWYNRQAIEQLAQHIPFERDAASKSEQIEMLRGLVIRHGRSMDPDSFGFEARNELLRLGLWSRIGPEQEA
ncbi:MAG: hypothetical protein ACJ788_27805 [Ktedonobacteraceae bacterium]|nr:MAG: hypothetical protein E6J36_09115 [Chloroflexota bacterium]TMD01159.1 MAG: hypothetical protein E6J11_03920 [Chloroflexota bacterium]